MLKLWIIYKQHVKTDTNLFIDIRLYSDPSIILFLPLSSSVPVPWCSTNSLPDTGILWKSLSSWRSVPPFHKLFDSWYSAPSLRNLLSTLVLMVNNNSLLTARVCLVMRFCYLLNIKYQEIREVRPQSRIKSEIDNCKNKFDTSFDTTSSSFCLILY